MHKDRTLEVTSSVPFLTRSCDTWTSSTLTPVPQAMGPVCWMGHWEPDLREMFKDSECLRARAHSICE